MALIKADRVKEVSTSETTANFILGGAATGYRTFSSVCAVGDTFYYAISNQSNGEWEVGLGTYGVPNILERTTVHASSNAGNKVNFSSGTKECFISATKAWLDTFVTQTSGTANYVAKTTGTGTIGDSQIFDNGTNVGIGTASPDSKLHAVGNIKAKFTTYHLSLTGDLPGYTAGAIPTLKSDATKIWFSSNNNAIGAWGTDTAFQGIELYAVGSGTGARINTNPSGVSYIADGNVGIGTTSPGAQLQVTTAAAATKGLIVKGAAAQSASVLELQNSSGVVAYRVNYDAAGTSHSTFAPGANQTVYHATYSGPSSSYNYCAFGYQATIGSFGYSGIGSYLSANGAPIYIHTFSSDDIVFVPGNSEKMRVKADGTVGIGTTSPAGQLHTQATASGTKALVVRGASGQSANLQEWQNNSGTALATVSSNGSISAPNIYGGGGYFISSGSYTGGAWLGVYKWLGMDGEYINIRKLYGDRTFPATNANGDYVEIARISRQKVHPITLTVHAAHGPNNGSVSKVYTFHSDYNVGSFTAAPSSSANVGEIDNFNFDIEVVAIDAYTSAVRARRNSSTTPTGAAFMFSIECHNYNRGAMTESSATGNSASPLAYYSPYQRIGPSVSAPPPVGGSGNGTDLTIAAASASGTGNGGSILLQAGAYATSGSNGKVIVRGLASNTANLQEWQNNAGTALSSVKSTGEIIAANGLQSYLGGVSSNVVIGYAAGDLLTGTANCISIGQEAGRNLIQNTVAIGFRAGNAVSGTNYALNPSNSVYIGHHTKGGVNTGGEGVPVTNEIVVGYLAQGKGNNTTVIGNSSTVSTDVFGTLTTTLGTATQKGIVVKAASGQNVNLQEWQNNAGSVLSAVNSAGDFTNTGGYSYTEKFGNAASVSSSYATAIGYGTTAGQLSTAVGAFAVASGVTSTAFGADANAAGSGGTALGRSANAAAGAVAVGFNASASGNNGIAVGRSAIAGTGTAIGYNFTGSGVGYTSLCASTDGRYATGAIDVFAGDGVNTNANISRQHSILGTWTTATYASRLGRVQLRVNDYTTDREAIRYESDGANALTSIGGAAVIASTTLAVQPAVSGNKGIVVKSASGQSANLQEWQNNAGTALGYINSDMSLLVTPATFTLGSQSNNSGVVELYSGTVRLRPSSLGNYILTLTQRGVDVTGGVGDTTPVLRVTRNADANVGPVAQFVTGSTTHKGITVVGVASQTGNLQEWQNSSGTALALVDASGNVRTTGSIQITSNTPSAFTADQNNLVLSASGFQRLSGTAARTITGIAPPSGASHVDGRIMRIYNVGSYNITLKHNSTSSSIANRFCCVQAIDIVLGPRDFAELIYDGTDGGLVSGQNNPCWRVA